jgi:pimeloyl-ACP methyl ester carboxylesterase
MPAHVSVAGHTWHVVDQGQGPVVLLLHGFPLSAALWDHQVAALAGRYRVLVPNLPGLGGTPPLPNDVLTMEQYAEGCVAMLDSLGINEPVVVAGLSMGGYIAFQFVRHFASRVRALGLFDTRAVGDTEEAAANRGKLADAVLVHGLKPVEEAFLPKLLSKEHQQSRPDLVKQTRAMMQLATPHGMAAALRGMARRPDVTADLATYNVPTLVVVGTDDVISPPAEMRGIAEAMPQARFVEIPASGHLSPLENPEAVNQAFRAFLDGLSN